MSDLVVLDPGARSLVQDMGFSGGRESGVPRSGVLDRDSLFLLNQLLDNPPDSAALEIAVTSPRLRVEGGAVRVACSGGLSGHVLRAGDKLSLPEWTAITVFPGDEVVLNSPERSGTALLGIMGGLDLPRIFGSQSTLLASSFGGIEGRSLLAGDRLRVVGSAPSHGPALHLQGRVGALGRIRVVLGPQAEWFTPTAIETFLGQDWQVTPALDRMGMRLSGPILQHNAQRGADIISDGVVPGAIQVPGEGQPIILLSDAQTIGGYPKIATIISADLSCVARLLPGDKLRFKAVSVPEAEAAARDHRSALDKISQSRTQTFTSVSAALYECNLVSGSIDAGCPDHFPGHLCPSKMGETK
jgi:biotin-dependent carboxylase-like uncharacterized protein